MILLPYGKNSIELVKHDNIKVFLPKRIKPEIDQIQLVNNSFESSELSNIQLEQWLNKCVAIGINDQTRPLPNEILIPALLNYLHKKLVPVENITFFIATGTHSPLKKSQFPLILDESIIIRYKIVSHDCEDETNLSYLGDTSAGTPVFINKSFYESDIKILIGNIEPHHFMGFSGGFKTASIGLTGRNTITANHAMLTHPRSQMGLFHSNPMRRDVEEIGKMIGVQAALNVIINDEKEIISSYWGKPESVIGQGINFINNKLRMDLTHEKAKYDLVIASPGGYPKDINFYQAQKAITHAGYFCKPGASIILIAECKDGLGSDKFQSIFDQGKSLNSIIGDFERLPFEIGPHKAYQLAKQLLQFKIILVSNLDKKTVEKMHLIYANNLNHAFTIAKTWIDFEKIAVAVLPYATHVLPNTEDLLDGK